MFDRLNNIQILIIDNNNILKTLYQIAAVNFCHLPG